MKVSANGLGKILMMTAVTALCACSGLLMSSCRGEEDQGLISGGAVSNSPEEVGDVYSFSVVMTVDDQPVRYTPETMDLGYASLYTLFAGEPSVVLADDGQSITLPCIPESRRYEGSTYLELERYDITTGEMTVLFDYSRAEAALEELQPGTDVYDYFDSYLFSFSAGDDNYIEVAKYSYMSGNYNVAYYISGAEGEYVRTTSVPGLDSMVYPIEDPLVVSEYPLRSGSALLVTDNPNSYNGEAANVGLICYLDDGHVFDMDLDRMLGEHNMFVTDVSQIDITHLLVSYYSLEDDLMTFDLNRKLIDVTSYSSPEVEDDSAIPACIDAMTYVYSLYDGTVCMSDDTALYILSEGGESIKILDYAYAGYNMADLPEMKLLKINDDSSMVFFQQHLSDTYSGINTAYDYSNSLVTITPDMEPDNRQVLRIGVPDCVPERTGRAVAEFNATNTEYFALIEVMNSGDSGYVSHITNADFPDDEYGVYLSMLCNNSDIIREQLQNDPPDVFISAGIMMNSADSGLFVDLNGYIDSADGLDRNDYYDNILRLSETDGHLYHMPESFYITGIRETVDRPSEVEYGGMTYDGYSDLVDEYDGWDPLSFYCSGDQYVEELISTQYDLFVDPTAGTANFHNAAFYALLDYIDGLDLFDYSGSGLSQYMGTVYLDDETVINMDQLDYGNVYYLDIGSMGYYDYDYSWYGLPSYDGRGLAAGSVVTSAIPVNASNPDGAWEFIRFSIGNDREQFIGVREIGIPINRNAVADTYMSSYDIQGRLDELISHAETWYVTDLELRYICHQVIGAYLNGECNADEAADIIENYMLEIMGSSGR